MTKPICIKSEYMTGGIAVIYGNYELVEEGEKVTKVILKTITESGEQNIAEVTNIEVTETDGQLDISFKFDFIVNLESIEIINAEAITP